MRTAYKIECECGYSHLTKDEAAAFELRNKHQDAMHNGRPTATVYDRQYDPVDALQALADSDQNAHELICDVGIAVKEAVFQLGILASATSLEAPLKAGEALDEAWKAWQSFERERD